MISHSKAARAWAKGRFECAVHQEEAAGFFDAIQPLCSTDIGDMDPDTTLDDWLASTGHAPFARSAAPIAVQTVHTLVREALRQHITRRQLLGPAAEGCTWDTDTLSARAIRAIINERVRRRGGCSCRSGSDGAG